jgi:hypothetical protein
LTFAGSVVAPNGTLTDGLPAQVLDADFVPLALIPAVLDGAGLYVVGFANLEVPPPGMPIVSEALLCIAIENSLTEPSLPLFIFGALDHVTVRTKNLILTLITVLNNFFEEPIPRSALAPVGCSITMNVIYLESPFVSNPQRTQRSPRTASAALLSRSLKLWLAALTADLCLFL